MTAFTRHPYRQGVTYIRHWLFAMGVATRLFASVLAFALHALLPFISIEPRFDLEATSAYLLERNQFIGAAAAKARARGIAGRNLPGSRRQNTPALV
ncbi:MAG: DUF6356 family protein [Woeseiaceae bacterium]|nr:DUF6356 family protein [Woeseiaceae bacterium]